jgi:hypothetical protein
MAQLREKTLFDQQKLDIERDKINAQHVSTLGQMAADLFKTHADIHQTHIQAESDQAIANTQARAAAQSGQGDGM